jgi:hypothetical protein
MEKWVNITGGVRMKGRRAAFCLVLAGVLLFPFFWIAGQPDSIPARQPALPLRAPDGDGLGSAQAVQTVEMMTPGSEWQRAGSACFRWVFLVLALQLQGTLRRKPCFVAVHHDKNKRFAVEGKTSHPQQAPPIRLQSLAPAL